MDKEKKINQLDNDELLNDEATDNSFEIISDVEENPELPDRLQEIAIEMQELEILMEQTEIAMVDEEAQEKYMPKFLELNDKYDQLVLEKKALKKKNKTAWDSVPVWMIVYAFIQFILCFPFISNLIWIHFGSWILSLYEGKLSGMFEASIFLRKFILALLIYALPIINILLSWTLSVNVVKKELDKKVFKIIFLSQIFLTVILAFWLFFKIVA